MEKIIFFSLVIPIFAFVLYLGVSAIMKGSEAKSALKEEANLKNDENKNLKPKCHDKDFVYKVTCKSCGDCYIGETKQPAAIRFRQHHPRKNRNT